MSVPLVSVIMSVYNGQEYLAEAMDSIIRQTYKNFEFIVINDGSTDDSLKILKKYAHDKRLKIFAQKNKGLVASLNRAIELARGHYIARQDADDISEPTRLEKQFSFLEKNSDVVIVGSNISVMDGGGNALHQHALLLNDTELRQELLVRSPFAHGSVIFKRQAAIDAGLYNPGTWPAEDYDLWLRLSDYGKLANLDEPLYKYREHPSGISMQNDQLQRQKLEQVRLSAWQKHKTLLSSNRVNLKVYEDLPMGQLRIERIIDNSLFIARQFRLHGERYAALKYLSSLYRQGPTYRKTAGKIKRGLKKR